VKEGKEPLELEELDEELLELDELELDEELLELEELELDEELLELDELELDDELLELELLDELEPPSQPAARGPAPVSVMLSIFAKPLSPLACKRILFQPLCRLRFTAEEFVQVVHAVEVLKSTLLCVVPLIITWPGRFALEPLA